MNIKQAICKTVDFIVYIPFALVLFIALGASMAGQTMNALIILAVGWIVASLLSAFWIVQSSIQENSQKQVELMEKVLKEMRGDVK